MRSVITKTTNTRLSTGIDKTTWMASKAHVTTTKGIRTLHRSKPPMINGENTVRKQYTEAGSKLLILAMLPVPKKATTMKKTKK